MRVVVDFDACECNAVCTGIAPEVFEITDHGELRVKVEELPEAYRERVEQAVRECPTLAISIAD